MLEVTKTPLSVATVLHSKEYLPFIDPFSLEKLKRKMGHASHLFVEGRIQGTLVALLVVSLFPRKETFHAKVISWLCLKEGGSALDFLNQTCSFLYKEQNVKSLEFLYTEEHILAPTIESYFGVKPPLHMIRLFFDALSFSPSWLYENKGSLEEASLFSWGNITERERKRIQHLCSQGVILPFLNPCNDENDIHKETSFGLLYRGEIAGWSITEKKNETTLCYSKFALDPHFRSRHTGLVLLTESMKKQKELLIPNAFFELNLYHMDLSWRNFVKKRLFPLCFKIEHLRLLYISELRGYGSI